MVKGVVSYLRTYDHAKIYICLLSLVQRLKKPSLTLLTNTSTACLLLLQLICLYIRNLKHQNDGFRGSESGRLSIFSYHFSARQQIGKSNMLNYSFKCHYGRGKTETYFHTPVPYNVTVLDPIAGMC